ncbi:hypothetical protein [Rhizobacter sp. P5_C2]
MSAPERDQQCARFARAGRFFAAGFLQLRERALQGLGGCNAIALGTLHLRLRQQRFTEPGAGGQVFGDTARRTDGLARMLAGHRDVAELQIDALQGDAAFAAPPVRPQMTRSPAQDPQLPEQSSSTMGMATRSGNARLTTRVAMAW